MAVVFVVLHHFTSAPWPGGLDSAGVDPIVVLSGFLVTTRYPHAAGARLPSARLDGVDIERLNASGGWETA